MAAGYTAFYGLVWVLDSAASEMTIPVGDNVEAACTADEACSGFNNLGKYVVGRIAGQAPSAVAVCTWIKDGECCRRGGQVGSRRRGAGLGGGEREGG